MKMEFIAVHWYLWLAIMLVGFGLPVANFFRQVRKVNTGGESVLDEIADSAGRNMYLAYASQTIGVFGVVMLIISVIANLIKFAC